jgi:hypothetical protein
MGRKSSKKQVKRERDATADASVRGDEAAPTTAVNPCANVTDAAGWTRKRARVKRTPADEKEVEAKEEADGPLSAADVARFEREGFVLLRGAFSPDAAHACRELLWTRLAREGVRREDARSWVERIGIPGGSSPQLLDMRTEI